MKPNNLQYLLILLLFMGLNSCVPDPRNAADAYRTTTLANQAAADQAQARDQNSQAFQQAQAERQATQDARIWAMTTFYRLTGLMLALAVCAALAGIGTGVGWAGIGVGRATARLAMLRANQIRLDPETRQYPVVMSYLGKGRYALGNPNTDGVMMLDTRQEGDRALIAASGAVELAGMVAREARLSKDATGVAMIMPTPLPFGHPPKSENDIGGEKRGSDE